MMAESQRPLPFPGGRKTAAIVLTHQRLPSFGSLLKAMNSVDAVAIIDNGSRPEILSQLKNFAEANKSKCLLIENGENLGIPRAYNRAVTRLHELGFHWFFFLDHDATFDETLFTDLGQAWNVAAGSGVRVGIVVPIVSDQASTFRTSVHLRRRMATLRSTITSGILINYDVFSAAHGFDDAVFLDGADFDLTFRVRELGMEIVRVNKVLIVQEFGNTPPAMNGLRTIIDRAIEMRSIIRVAMGNANIYRTTSAVYPTGRQQSMAEGLRHISVTTPGTWLDVKVIQALIDAERVVLRIARKIAHPGVG